MWCCRQDTVALCWRAPSAWANSLYHLLCTWCGLKQSICCTAIVVFGLQHHQRVCIAIEAGAQAVPVQSSDATTSEQHDEFVPCSGVWTEIAFAYALCLVLKVTGSVVSESSVEVSFYCIFENTTCFCWYRDCTGYIIEENSSVFCLIQGWTDFFYGGPRWKFYCCRSAAYIFCLLKLQF